MSPMFKLTSLLILLLANGMVVAKNRQVVKSVEPPSPPPVELVLTLPDDELHQDQTANPQSITDEQNVSFGQKSHKPVNVGCKVDMPNNIYVDSLDKKLQGNCDLSLRY